MRQDKVDREEWIKEFKRKVKKMDIYVRATFN
jgi:hypothetical protein